MSVDSSAIADKAARANGWDRGDTVVTRQDALSRDGCTVYTAYSAAEFPPLTLTYAVLDDGRILSRDDPDAVGPVVSACGQDAPAALVAEIVTRFHPDLPFGRVAREQANISSIAHKWAVRDGGYEFHPPRTAPADPRTVLFYMTDMEGDRLYHVQATLRDGQAPLVEWRAIGGD